MKCILNRIFQEITVTPNGRPFTMCWPDVKLFLKTNKQALFLIMQLVYHKRFHRLEKRNSPNLLIVRDKNGQKFIHYSFLMVGYQCLQSFRFGTFELLTYLLSVLSLIGYQHDIYITSIVSTGCPRRYYKVL